MSEAKHTAGQMDVFVGNANGRGLIRLEIRGTGQHIASMPRGAQSEADAMRLAHCWDCHDEMLDALKNVNKLISEAAMTGFNYKDGDWPTKLFDSQQKTSAAIAKAEGR